MKIIVYAITKNEEQNVVDWIKSMKEADGIYVLDTGSTDNTVSLLEAHGAHVESKKIEPWRFDKARNLSLRICPEDADLYVCTDLDERFEPGWREALEKSFVEGSDRQYKYKYIWSHTKDGNPGVQFWYDKIHTKNYRWKGPVHETLQCMSKAQDDVYVNNMILHHYPDPMKSRASYLNLLELAVKEEPHNDRYRHYLGREYFFHGEWQKAINTLNKHLKMPEAKWNEERAASHRYIAKCYVMVKFNSIQEQVNAIRTELIAAIAEAPQQREAYMELAKLCYNDEEWYGVIHYCQQAIAITVPQLTYMVDPEVWGVLPYDLLHIAYYKIGLLKDSLRYLSKCIQMEPENDRFMTNFDNILREI